MRQMEEKNINKLQINECATFELRRRCRHAHSAGFRTPDWKRQLISEIHFHQVQIVVLFARFEPRMGPAGSRVPRVQSALPSRKLGRLRSDTGYTVAHGFQATRSVPVFCFLDLLLNELQVQRTIRTRFYQRRSHRQKPKKGLLCDDHFYFLVKHLHMLMLLLLPRETRVLLVN